MDITSPSISVLEYDVIFDLSPTNPTVKLVNRSTVQEPTNLKFDVKLTSPNGLVISQVTNFNASADWTTYTLPDTLPLILGHIEWGGIGFTVDVTVTDSESTPNTATLSKTAEICRPYGNTFKTGNNYGLMLLGYEVKCERAQLYIEEKSNYTYTGTTGSMISKIIKLIYPASSATETPDPFISEANFSNAYITIYSDGEGYQLISETVREYAFGDGVYVRIKYRFAAVFAVQCLTDVCDIAAGFTKFKQALAAGTCTPAERDKLILINANLNLILLGKMHPACLVNIPKLIADTIDLLGCYYTKCGCDYGLHYLTQSSSTSSVPVFAKIQFIAGNPDSLITRPALSGANPPMAVGDTVYVIKDAVIPNSLIVSQGGQRVPEAGPDAHCEIAYGDTETTVTFSVGVPPVYINFDYTKIPS